MILAATVAIVIIAPIALSHQALRRWCVYDARYQITPSGLSRECVRRARTAVLALPPNRSFAWNDVLLPASEMPDGTCGECPVLSSAPMRRTIRLRGRQRRFRISSVSDPLNPWSAVRPYTIPDGRWTDPGLEDFMLAAIYAFTRRWANEAT